MKTKTPIILAGLIALVVISFFAYNLLISSPCDTIFEQTTSQLDTKIKIIEAEGEISIGKKKIQDLTESAQLTSINLKTCCIALNAKQISSEQFLECKDSGKKYAAKIETVITHIHEIKQARETGDESVIKEKIRQIDITVEEAKNISQTVKVQLKEIQEKMRKSDKTVEKPKDISHTTKADNPANKRNPVNVKESKEIEPNNDLFTPNIILMNQWISGSIMDVSDKDYFKITTPKKYRDVIKIELENQTTMIRPRIGLYDNNKKWFGGTTKHGHLVTPGQNKSYSFSSEASTVYYVYIGFLDKNLGEYKFIVRSLKAYDDFEPNDDILHVKTIDLTQTISANFTDKYDQDYYRIETSSTDGAVKITFENLSLHTKPRIGIYDNNKKWFGGTTEHGHLVTSGQNMSYSFKTKANTIYSIYIRNLSNVPGSYKLTVEEQ